MKNTFFILLSALTLITLPACKKQQTIFEALVGDWGLVQSNRNGIVNNYNGDEITWAVYSCQDGCDASLLYTQPSPGNYDAGFRVSGDEKWLIKDTGDSLQILELNSSTLVTRYRSTGVLLVETWYKK